MMTVQEFRATKGKSLSRFDMSQTGVLTIHITPMGKPRMTQRDKWDKRACVVRYRELADRLRAVCAAADYGMGDCLYVDFYLPMPKSWSKKKKAEKIETVHDQKPDIDNMVKSVMDSLSKDDKAVSTVFARKYWSETGQPGKIVLYPSQDIFLSANKK